MNVIQAPRFKKTKGRGGLAARCVSLKVGGKSLLKGLSLRIEPGEVLAVVGPNGAGKSTLLKVLAGEKQADFGSLTLNDRELRDIPLSDLARFRAVLPQETQLSFPFKVEEVVAMGRSPHPASSRERNQAIVVEAMEEAEVSHLKGRDYTTLSGGERQRVQLARVLSQVWGSANDQARYLLLDEPTSALDLSHQHSVLTTATRFARQNGMGVLAVLHDLNLAAYYADRVAVLKDGCLLCCGSPKEVLTPERIAEAFNLSTMVLQHPRYEDCPLVVTPVDDESRAEKRVEV